MAPGPLSSQTRTRINHGIDWALQSLRAAGLVEHDGHKPATWSLTDLGRSATDADIRGSLTRPRTPASD